MEGQRPKVTIVRQKESMTITLHGTTSAGQQLDQHISFNCYGATHRRVFNQFADSIMCQKKLTPERVYKIARSYDKKYVNVMGVSKAHKSNSSVCKVIF